MFVKKPFVRHKKNGVSRIVRDNYGRDPKTQVSTWRVTADYVKKRDGYRCVRCFSTEGLEVHHIVPLSKGGTTTYSNLITLCTTCHDKRHSHLVVGSKSRSTR